MISLIVNLLDAPPQLWESGKELLTPWFSHSIYTVIGTIIAIPALYFLLFSQKAKSPPSFPVLAPILKGKFNFKKSGPCDLIRHGYETLGPVFRIRFFHRHVSVMMGPMAQNAFFSAHDTQLNQREVYGFTVPVFGKGIVYDAPLQIMIQQLKFVRKGLTEYNMAAHCGKVVKEATEYFDQWGDEGEVDLFKCLSELTILSASRCLLGDEIRNNVQVEFAELYQQLSDGMSHLSFFIPNFPSKAHKKRDEARAKIHKIFSKVIEDRRRSNAKGHTDFLQVILDARYRDGRTVTTDDTVGLLLAGLFAGQHTSNITGTWLGLSILLSPRKEELLERILKEQEQVLGASNGEITLEALSSMEVLHACMKETLRMHPPLIILMRKALVDIPVGDYVIPKGDICVTCPSVANRLPELFPKPDEFDPDRFLAPRNEDEQAKHAFISFGGGRHRCLGEKFAYLQTKTIWSHLFRTFDFEPVSFEMPEPDYGQIVVGPLTENSKCMVRFKRKVPKGV